VSRATLQLQLPRLAGKALVRAKARRFQLERDLEDAAVRYAHQELGFTSRKMNGLGFRAWPDRLFIWPKGNRQEYVEFKKVGEEPTVLQLQMHRLLRARGCVVHVVDNWVDFYAFVRS
jgi:hypothetical protein